MSTAVPRCPECASPLVDHVWRADMAHLTLIDQWKCRDVRCSHRWDTTVTYTQLQATDMSELEAADGGQAGRPAGSDAMSGTGGEFENRGDG